MKAVLALLLLFGAAYPIGRELRARAPEAPAANRIGMGRLMGGVLTGPFRPMLQTYLWIRADILYGQGRYDELAVLFDTMTSLYPDNDAAKEFLGWHVCFNLKNEAPSPEIAWMWSEKGLDTLADLPNAHRQLADWFLKQCGQNPVWSMRYAGKAWMDERAFRVNARVWARQRWGEDLGRFDAGLRALKGRTKFFDRLRRLSLLTYGAYDDCVRTGRSDKFAPAAALARRIAGELDIEGMPAPEGWKRLLEERAEFFLQIEAGRPSPELIAMGEYLVAMALWGIGAHRKDPELLRAALETARLFAKREVDLAVEAAEEIGDREPKLPDYSAELSGIAAWIAYVDDRQKRRPPLPFD